MDGIVFQCGTAFHLALLTVAPFFLCPVCGPQTSALAIFGLCFFGALWIVMNPSPQFGEWPRDARARIGREIFRDPLFFVACAAIILAFVRAVNGGIDQEYEAGAWRMCGPAVGILPGSVSGSGVLPLAGMFALSVVTIGVRHALGERARSTYLFLSGVLAALAVAFWCLMRAHGVRLRGLARAAEDPVFFGTALGVILLFAVVAWIASWSRRSILLELLSAAGVSGVLAGLLRFAPAVSIWTFCILAIVLLAAGIWLVGVHRTSAAWFRTAVGLFVILAPVALFLFEPAARSAFWPLFPADFFPARAAASSVAVSAWRSSPQLGVGLGAYPLALQFFASPADWRVLSPLQSAAPNGWVQVLFERGFLGCAVVLAAAFFLVKDIVLRFVRAPRGWAPSIALLTGPAVLAGVVAVTFLESTFVQVELLIPLCAALVLTAAELPEGKES